MLHLLTFIRQDKQNSESISNMHQDKNEMILSINLDD